MSKWGKRRYIGILIFEFESRRGDFNRGKFLFSWDELDVLFWRQLTSI
jgi:hypothetical protein